MALNKALLNGTDEARQGAPVVTSVTKNSGAVAANRVRTSLSGFFTWAMEQGRLDTNPVVGTTRNKEKSRDRVFAPAELRAIWSALGDDDFGDILRLLTLIGQRAGEIAGLTFSEIHDGMIVLAGDRTKNHRAHVVPLSSSAKSILTNREKACRAPAPVRPRREAFFGLVELQRTLGRQDRKSNWCSPAPLDTARPAPRLCHLCGGMPAHLLEKLPARDKKMAHGLGIEPHVVEAVLNHVSGHKAGVAGIYNRSSYECEKKRALDLWAGHLTAIVED
jgi:integrase